MYRILILLGVLVMSLPSYCSIRTISTQHSYHYFPSSYNSAYYGGDYIPNRSLSLRRYNSRFSDINDLEKYAMNRSYQRDNDLTRLERLEMRAFGAVQQGDINSRYANVRNAILSRPKQNYKTGLLRNISDYFNGQLTGSTPSIQDYGVNTQKEYFSPWGNGYMTKDYGISTGSGVHILD